MSVVVVGGGAAGLTAAHFASREGAAVRVLEKTREAGKKILISGGTRCNVLSLDLDLERDYFTSSSRYGLNAVFRSWSLESCREWLTSKDGLGLSLQLEDETQKYFPKSNSAKDVRNALLRSCEKHGVTFEYNCDVRKLRRREDATWECLTQDQRAIQADRVILASGGMSYPEVGTDGAGYRILEKLGHTLRPPRPALTPLYAPHPGDSQLAGVSLQSVDVSAAAPTQRKLSSQRSGLLFTHRGFSGPSILDVSHCVTAEETPSAAEIYVNWTHESGEEWDKRLKEGSWKGTVPNFISRFEIPSRLAAALCTESAVPLDRTLSHLTKKERRRLVEQLTRYQVRCSGHGGFRLAEVTSGGVPFEEIDTATMESRRASGIYICGELVDIFGRIGGFNFYWAWVSGRLAALGATR